jgi:hypothetical protein
MYKKINFETFQKYCGEKELVYPKFICEHHEYITLALVCGEKNCPIWKRLKPSEI